METEEGEGQSFLLALRRKWKWVVGGASLGLLAAVLASFLLPKTYTASVDVLLFSTDAGSIERASRMETAAALAESIPVADRALDTLGSDRDPEALLKQYSASPQTDELLRIDASGATAALAARRVSAIATAYLDYISDEADGELASAERAVDARKSQIESRIDEVEVRIAGLSGSSDQLTPEQSLLLTSLVGQRTALSQELSDAQATLDQAQAEHRLTIDRNKMLAEPLLPKAPSSPRPRELAVIGFFVGALLVAGVIVTSDVLGRRLFRRDEFARAAGVSVVATLNLKRPRSLRTRRRRRRLAKMVVSPSKELSNATRSLASVLRARSASAPPPPVVVTSMGADDEALILTLRLAMDLAGQRWERVRRADSNERRTESLSNPPRPPGRRWRDIMVIDCTNGDEAVVGPLVRSITAAKGQTDDPAIGQARSFRARRISSNGGSPKSEVSWQSIFPGTPPLAVFGAMSEPRADRNGRAQLGAVESSDLVIAFIGDWRSATEAANHLPRVDGAASLIVARSGKVTAANVQENATALRRAGATPVGVVVIGPDSFDTSTGQLDAPLTADRPASSDVHSRGHNEPEFRALRRM